MSTLSKVWGPTSDETIWNMDTHNIHIIVQSDAGCKRLVDPVKLIRPIQLILPWFVNNLLIWKSWGQQSAVYAITFCKSLLVANTRCCHSLLAHAIRSFAHQSLALYRRELLCSAKPKGSNCSLKKSAVTAFWLCMALMDYCSCYCQNIGPIVVWY